MVKEELLRYQLISRGLEVVENISSRGQVILGDERQGLVVIESCPKDIQVLKRYLSFCGYSYLVRIRSRKTQILVKV